MLPQQNNFMFQFHNVRLKVIRPIYYIITYLFQFHKVQLKDSLQTISVRAL